MKRLTVFLLTAILLCTVLFSACNSLTKSENLDNSSPKTTNPQLSDGTKSSDDKVTYPITISHVYGETVIKSKPERIVTLGWENQATPLALGIAPVGVSAANYGEITDNNIHPWTDKAFHELGIDSPNVFDETDSFDYEAISDVHPDIILAVNSGITQEEYNILSEIAPTIAYPEKAWQVSWQQSALIASEAIGMGPQGEKLVEDTEKLIKEKVAAYPAIAGKKAAFCWISPDDFSTFSIYLPGDSRADYLIDLGLELPESIAKLKENNDNFYIDVSRENVDQLNDVEMIVVYGDPAMLTALQADPLMNRIPAIRDGAMVFIGENSALGGGASASILSIPYNIDTYLEKLNTAAEAVQ